LTGLLESAWPQMRAAALERASLAHIASLIAEERLG
jgi:hypothetical protein